MDLQSAGPILIVWETDLDMLAMKVTPRPGDTPAAFGRLLCDAVRNAARQFGVSDDEVWRGFDAERTSPTRTRARRAN